MADTIEDILDDGNKDIKSLLQYKNNTYFMNLLNSAYDPNKKFVLPEGEPPYKKSGLHRTITKGMFWQICRKIEVFRNTQMKQLARESHFIAALESLSDQGALIMLHVKDQSLDKLYPNLTKEALTEIGML